MRILPILQRLKDNVELLDGRVEQAKSLTSLPDSEIKTGLPIAFVYSSSDSSPGLVAFNSAGQKVDVEFTVIIASRPVDIDNGTEAMEDIRDEIKAALIGWDITPGGKAVGFVSGSVLDVSSKIVWWADTYNASFFI